MKTDRYVRGILTAIAVLLFGLIVQNSITRTVAQAPIYVQPAPGAVFPVSLASGQVLPVDLVSLAGGTTGVSLPVNIVAVGGGNTPLPVRLVSGP